jgi:hypothetical protein
MTEEVLGIPVGDLARPVGDSGLDVIDNPMQRRDGISE